MKMVARIDEPENGLALKVNGTTLAVGRRPKLAEWTPALRGIALSDSPVLVQASDQDAAHILEQLHRLGRRSELPIHHCHTESEGTNLLRGMSSDGIVAPESMGTWAIFNVHWWSEESQTTLGRVLESFDEARLHGRLSHSKIPRVVVTMSAHTQASNLREPLRQRLAYYHLSATAPKAKGVSNAPA
jgi:hypothetical protein